MNSGERPCQIPRRVPAPFHRLPQLHQPDTPHRAWGNWISSQRETKKVWLVNEYYSIIKIHVHIYKNITLKSIFLLYYSFGVDHRIIKW